MVTDNVELDIDGIAGDGERAIAAAASTDALAEVETELLGKRSVLTRAHRTLGSLTPRSARRPVAGSTRCGRASRRRLAARRAELAEAEREEAMRGRPPRPDRGHPGLGALVTARGHLHLVTQARAELEDLFVGMGFTVAEGPEAESDWYNFEALNIPPSHPARDMYDTMYLEVGEPETVLLRTHTSPVQIHLMEEAVRDGTLPIHAVMPGKCYRLDTPDARHLPVFNQIEGLVVDRGITFGDLAGTIQIFTEAYFGPGMQSRLRPAYFPFTEPSAEFEITCTICLGEGCRTCSHTGWIELGAAAWSTRRCSPRSGSIPPSGPASPSASASTAWPRCATRCPTCAPSWRTTSDSSRSSDLTPPTNGKTPPTTVRAPLSWLRDFAPFPDDVGALRATLDDLGLVVEAIEHVGEGLGDVVVAQVRKIEAIKGADKIQLVTVDAGAEPLEIVCGASNFVVGDRVPLAPVGAILPGGFEIGRRKLRGVVSNGMLCSGKELGLSDDQAGLLILGDEAPGDPGTPLIEALGLEPDVVFDITVEGNRPDAWSMAASPATWRPGSACPSPTPSRPSRRRAVGRSSRRRRRRWSRSICAPA